MSSYTIILKNQFLKYYVIRLNVTKEEWKKWMKEEFYQRLCKNIIHKLSAP